MVVSQFAANALALIATAVIGRLGTAELAAAAYANAIYYLGFIMLIGVMFSVAPRVARAHGAGDIAAVGRTLQGGLWLAMGLTLVCLPVMWLVAARLPAFAPPDIRADLAATYLKIYALGMLPNLAFIALRGTLEGTGKPRVVTAISLLGVGFAALVSPALAYGWGPLPRLGLTGAAVTSVLATWGMALALWPLSWGQAAGAVSVQGVRQEVGALLRLGWPIGLTLGAEGACLQSPPS
ncbi:MATE family efflux transporter [Deinococcus malanensis]|uniref:MATE family efflux transporter n=1 Tax=Deinococcus malanensis TaxID=1706855 RepID=UPI00363435A8